MDSPDSDSDPKMILQTDLELDKLRSAHVTEAINIGQSDGKVTMFVTTRFFSLFNVLIPSLPGLY